MDLLVIEEAPARFRKLSQKASITTHRPIMGEGRVVMLRSDGTPKGIIRSMRELLLQETLTEDICITRDTTFVVNGIDPWKPWAHEKSNYLKRKGVITEAMTVTLGLLLETGRYTYDFEPKVPRAMRLAELKETLDMAGDAGPLLQTLHFNRVGAVPVRIADPELEQWRFNFKPDMPALNLSPLCYQNPDCHTWQRSLLNGQAV